MAVQAELGWTDGMQFIGRIRIDFVVSGRGVKPRDVRTRHLAFDGPLLQRSCLAHRGGRAHLPHRRRREGHGTLKPCGRVGIEG
jgi:hypothetical protein